MRRAKIKVAVAMSGGVDSGVAAALLVKKGYQVSGFHLQLWSERVKNQTFANKCCGSENLAAARQTAYQLGIPFYTIDFKKEFKKKVVDYFLREYLLGRTPNPCLVCNRFIKFGQLLDYIQKLNYEVLATGHYARLIKENNHYWLRQARDRAKDQTYFLYSLSQKQLARVLFPVGNFYKKEVMMMAKKWLLPVAERPESQEVCFYPESDYRPFLKRQLGEKIKPGEVVDLKKNLLGKHQGLPLYTIGQRRGLEINPLKGLKIKGRKGDFFPPYYVLAKKPKKNQLVVGFGKETEVQEFQVGKINWFGQTGLAKTKKKRKIKCRIRIRHQGDLLEGWLEKVGQRIKVTLKEGERGIAPGQAAVFYQRSKLIGGGIIL